MSERWIVIRNWFGPKGFQHYKDRDPRWVKVYAELMSDDDYLDLSLASRGVLCGLWLEYARSDGRLPTRRLSARLGQQVRDEHLTSLIQAGFIEISASKPPRISASPRALAREEKKREEKKKGATHPSPNGAEPAPYAHHGKPRPDAARTWIDNGLALEIPDVALRSVIADEFNITNGPLLDELVDRAAQVKAHRKEGAR